MPFTAWKQLMPEQQAQWDQLPNEAKEIILAGTKSRTASDGRKANLHDMSAQDYLESQLKALKEGTRKHPVMGAIAAQLSGDDIANTAAYFLQVFPLSTWGPQTGTSGIISGPLAASSK